MAENLFTQLSQSSDLNPNNIRTLGHYLRKWNLSEYEAILQCKIFTEGRLADLIAERYGLERLPSDLLEHVDKTVLRTISYQSARLLCCLAICVDPESSKTRIAVSDPSSKSLQDFLKDQFPNRNYELLVATKSEINEALSIEYEAEALFFL